MHRVNRSAPWKEQARAGLAPDLSVRQCQKGGSGRLSFRPTLPSSQSSFAPLSNELGSLDGIGEHVVPELLGRVAPSPEPSVRMRSRMSAWLRFLTISARSRANIEVGSFAGAAKPYQTTTSNPGSASATAGLADRAGKRPGVVTAPRADADSRLRIRRARPTNATTSRQITSSGAAR